MEQNDISGLPGPPAESVRVRVSAGTKEMRLSLPLSLFLLTHLHPDHAQGLIFDNVEFNLVLQHTNKFDISFFQV